METILAMGEDDFRKLKRHFRNIIEDTTLVANDTVIDSAPDWKLVSMCGKVIRTSAALLAFFEEHAKTNGSVVRICLYRDVMYNIETACDYICQISDAYPKYAKQMSESRINAVRSLKFTVCGR